jgi:hypothetical protein
MLKALSFSSSFAENLRSCKSECTRFTSCKDEQPRKMFRLDHAGLSAVIGG